MESEESPLRKLNQAIDRFCALHPRFGIPNLMRYVVFINIAFYILDIFAGGTFLELSESQFPYL